MKNKIGILGSGAVGIALANGFIKHAYETKIGTNDVGKHKMLKDKTNDKVEIDNFENVAAWADIIVLAVKGSVAISVMKQISAEHLQGKTIIDTTNPIADAPPTNGVLVFFTGVNDSLLEQLQKTIPTANFVKAFNSVGSAFMVNPDFGNDKPSMFICGNNDAARNTVKEILIQFGWDVEDMGKAEAARAIEPLCMLWCIPGFLQNRWSHAFKLLSK
jgi:predicted dinucleotide-binding enzyme